MSGFYRLLILLFIFIYKTNEVRLPHYEYLTAITGKLTCKYPVGKGAVVTLYTKSVRKSRRNVLTSKYVEYGNAFFISGTMRRFVTPRVYLKIYHICTTSKIPYIVKYIKEINWYYTTRLGTRGHFLDLGVLELSKLIGMIIRYPKHLKKTNIENNLFREKYF